jgi:hypothetical protein
LRKRSDGSFEGVVLPPIEPVRTGNRDADVRATMQLVVEHLEKIIRRSPHQWYMFRNMWPAAGEAETVKRKVPLRAAAVLTSLAGGIGLSWLLHTNHAPAALEQAAKP